MRYHYVWLMWSSAFLLPWLALYVLNPRHRRVMWGTSLATALLGVTEPLYVPAYWNPPSLFDLAQRTRFDLESFIFCFAIGGARWATALAWTCSRWRATCATALGWRSRSRSPCCPIHPWASTMIWRFGSCANSSSRSAAGEVFALPRDKRLLSIAHWHSLMSLLISLGAEKITDTRSPCIPDPTTTGLPGNGPLLLESVFSLTLNSHTLSVVPAAVLMV